MYELFLILRGAAIGLLLLLFVFLLTRYRQLYVGKLLAALILCLCGYLLAPLVPQGSTVLLKICTAPAEATPLVFLLAALAIFEEHKRPDRGLLVFGVIFILLALLRSPLAANGASELTQAIVFYGPHLVKIGFVALAMAVVSRHWRSDLVEGRRTLRAFLVPVVGTYMSLVLLVELYIGMAEAPLWLEALHSLGVATVALVFVVLFVGLEESDFLPLPLPLDADNPALDAADQGDIETLREAMEQQHRYREMSLTIRSLAAQLNIPEHRLRVLVNRALGYRNFSDFLNQYRVADAVRRFRDPNCTRLPILTIAMDAGYRSMTTFNKAFKSLEGLTPTEFRQQARQNLQKAD
jgi:AraC-like DNA-binding protein